MCEFRTQESGNFQILLNTLYTCIVLSLLTHTHTPTHTHTHTHFDTYTKDTLSKSEKRRDNCGLFCGRKQSFEKKSDGKRKFRSTKVTFIFLFHLFFVLFSIICVLCFVNIYQKIQKDESYESCDA